MFDNVLITDSKRVAEEWAADSWAKKALQEKMGEGRAFYMSPPKPVSFLTLIQSPTSFPL